MGRWRARALGACAGLREAPRKPRTAPFRREPRFGGGLGPAAGVRSAGGDRGAEDQPHRGGHQGKAVEMGKAAAQAHALKPRFHVTLLVANVVENLVGHDPFRLRDKELDGDRSGSLMLAGTPLQKKL